jgi:hypothetical protein
MKTTKKTNIAPRGRDSLTKLENQYNLKVSELRDEAIERKRTEMTIGHILGYFAKNVFKDTDKVGTSPSSMRLMKAVLIGSDGADQVGVDDHEAFMSVICSMIDEAFQAGIEHAQP